MCYGSGCGYEHPVTGLCDRKYRRKCPAQQEPQGEENGTSVSAAEKAKAVAVARALLDPIPPLPRKKGLHITA